MKYPKKRRVKLSSAEYIKLRHTLYQRAYAACEVCFRGYPFNELDIHHKISKGAGGDDSYENCTLVCRECHTKIHMGLI